MTHTIPPSGVNLWGKYTLLGASKTLGATCISLLDIQGCVPQYLIVKYFPMSGHDLNVQILAGEPRDQRKPKILLRPHSLGAPTEKKLK